MVHEKLTLSKVHCKLMFIIIEYTVRAALLATPLISRPPTKKMLIFGFYSIFKLKFYQEKCVREQVIVMRVR